MSIRVFNKPAVVIGGGSSATLSSISISSNGTYSASLFGVDGFDVVDVDVQGCSERNDLFVTYESPFEFSFSNGVKNIPIGAFAYNGNIGILNLNKITNIKDETFSRCAIRKLYGPDVTVCYDGFSSCTNLEEISFPNCVYFRSLYNTSTSLCLSLSLPECRIVRCFIGVYNITQSSTFSFGLPKLAVADGSLFGSTVFSNYYHSVSVSFPELVLISSAFALPGVTSFYAPKLCFLGYGGIYGANKLLSFSIESGFIDGMSSCFNSMTHLETITLKDTIVSMTSRHFYSCPKVSLIDGIIGLYGNFQASGMSLLKYLSLTYATNNFVAFSNKCFYDCSSLESLYILACSIPTLANANVFANTPMSNENLLGHFGSIYVPSSWVASFKAATGWVAYSDRITALPSEYDEKYIYAFEFANNQNITEIPLSKKNAECVFALAFSGCKSLVSINLPNCRTIDYAAFSSCGSNGSKITYISFPECRVLGMAVFNSAYMSISTVLELPNMNVLVSYAFSKRMITQAFISGVSLPNCRVINRGIANFSSTEHVYAPKAVFYMDFNATTNGELGDVVYLDLSVHASHFDDMNVNNNSNIVHIENIYMSGYRSPNGTLSFPNAAFIGTLYSCNFSSYYFPKAFTIAQISNCYVYHITADNLVEPPMFQSVIGLSKIRFKAARRLCRFSRCNYLQQIVFDVANTANLNTNQGMFESCTKIESLYLFANTVIARNSYFSMASLIFSSTPFVNSTYLTPNRFGSIFVRASLLSYYQNDDWWKGMSERFVGMTDEQIEDFIDNWED